MDSQIVCERCDRTDCVSVVHDHLDALIPCQACRREDGFPFVCDGKPVDWRARLAEVERERDAANARAEKAEAALAKVVSALEAMRAVQRDGYDQRTADRLGLGDLRRAHGVPALQREIATRADAALDEARALAALAVSRG